MVSEFPSLSSGQYGLLVLDHVESMLGYWDKNLVCRFANKAYIDWFGRTKEDLINSITLEELLGKELFLKNLPYVKSVLEGESQQFEQEIITPTGELRHSIVNYFPHCVEDEKKGFFVHVVDISKLKSEAATRIKIEEERFQLALQATKDGIWDWDIRTNKEYFSARWCEIIGYDFSDPELPHTYDAWESRIHPDHREPVIKALKSHLENRTPYEVEYLHLHRSGEYRWQKSAGKAQFNEQGKPVRMVGSISDIHTRKLAEEDVASKNIELRRLYTHLLRIREEERMKISREIHDVLGQHLSFLKIELNRLKKRPGKDSVELASRYESMLTSLNESISFVRKVSVELRPSVLDNLGLIEAIEWFTDQYSSSTSIPVSFSTNIKSLEIPPEQGTGVYRILQESLTNAAKHSAASLVTVTLDYDNNNLFLIITDNGCGFDYKSQTKTKCLGLIGMRERALLLSGSLKIQSSKEIGTTIILVFPISIQNSILK